MALATASQQVISDIQNHMANCGGKSRDWYVGIAANPRQRLFNDHNVDQNNDSWIFRDCGNHRTARVVETHFHNMGCDGGPGGGDGDTRYVYAYRKAPHTRE